MPKNKPIEKKIDPLYRASTIDVMMVVWVEALRSKVPLSITSCIKDFYNYFNLSEDDYPLDTANVIYQRMRNLLNEWERNNECNSQPL